MSADETDAKFHPLETDLQSDTAAATSTAAASRSPSLQEKPIEMPLDMGKAPSPRGEDQRVTNEEDLFFVFEQMRASRIELMDSLEPQQQSQYTSSSVSTMEPSADFTSFSA